MNTLLPRLRACAALSMLCLVVQAAVAKPDAAPAKSEAAGRDDTKELAGKDAAKAAPAKKGALLVVRLRTPAGTAAGAKPIAGATVYLKSKPQLAHTSDNNGVAKIGDIATSEVKLVVLVGVAPDCTISLRVAGGEQNVDVEIPTACEAPH